MKTKCPMCALSYDDAEASTVCPHRPLFANPEDLERKKLGIALLGQTIRFNHQSEGPDYRVKMLYWNGMVELHDMTGEFAPHLFVVVEDQKA